MDRREVLAATVAATALAGASGASHAQSSVEPGAAANAANGGSKFWPDGVRMVVSMSLMFEAGAQPAANPYAPFSPLGDPDTPYRAVDSWFDYGVNEGVPRLLDLFDRHKIKVSSFMVGKAVERYPALAREIVQRGHEAAAHGHEWKPHWRMSPAEETASYVANIAAIERATGIRPCRVQCICAAQWTQHLGYSAILGI